MAVLQNKFAGIQELLKAEAEAEDHSQEIGIGIYNYIII